MVTDRPSRHVMVRWARIARLGTTLLILVALSPPVAANESSSYAAGVAYERGAHAFRLGELASALEFLERATELAPEDLRIVRLYSLALISSGQAQRASELLLATTRADADDDDLHFVRALAHYRAGELTTARAGFAQVLQAEPEHAQAQLFLGTTLQELGEDAEARIALRAAQKLDPNLAAAASYRLGLLELKAHPEKARGHFEIARDQSNGTPLSSSAQEFLRQLPDPLEPRSRMRAAASAGLEYDSNANIVGDDPLMNSERARDMRAFVRAGISTRLLETERFRLHAGLVGFMANHADQKNYDVQAGRGALFGSAALARRLNADLQVSLESAWQDTEHYHRRVFAKQALRFRENRSNETRIYLSFENRDEFYKAIDPRLDHDGKVRRLGIDHSLLLPDPNALGLPSWGPPLLTASYQKRREDTHGADYDSRSNIYRLSLRAPMPAQVRLETSAELEVRRFDNPTIIEPTAGPRHERVQRFNIGLSRPLNDRFTLLGRYHSTNWKSNVQGFAFKRQIFSMMVTYSFQ
ncbi:MAG: tetratricopeptide repeat protein [bacterium]|nr:tetratricopeptide repeat protein [bacterium]